MKKIKIQFISENLVTGFALDVDENDGLNKLRKKIKKFIRETIKYRSQITLPQKPN